MTNAEAMEQIIEALHAAAKALDEAANQLAGQKKPQKTAAPAVNKAEKTLTLEEVRKVAADRSRQGFTDEVRSLIQKHGANNLSSVDAAQYSTLLKELEAIGHAG